MPNPVRLVSDSDPMAKKRLPPAVREFFKKQGAAGGKIGGRKRMEGMTEEQRTTLAKKAAAARWGKNKANQKLK
jgi:hypothetical protein